MNKLHLLFVLLLTTINYGCSAATVPKSDLKKEARFEFIFDRLKKNGPNIFCSQPSYQECFSQTKNQCMNEISTFNGQCIQAARDKYYPIKNKEDEVKFLHYYDVCVATTHRGLHVNQSDQITNCLKNNPIDKKILRRSALESLVYKTAQDLVDRSIILRDTTALYWQGKIKYTANAGDSLTIVRQQPCINNRTKECWVVRHPKYGVGAMPANRKLLK